LYMSGSTTVAANAHITILASRSGHNGAYQPRGALRAVGGMRLLAVPLRECSQPTHSCPIERTEPLHKPRQRDIMELSARHELVVVQTERMDARFILTNQSDIRVHKRVFEGVRDLVQCLEDLSVVSAGG